MSEIDETWPPFQASPEAKLLTSLLRHKQVGELVTYREMNEHIHGDVQRQDRCKLTTARRHLKKHHRMLFETIEGEGIRLMSDQDKAERVGRDATEKTRRAAHRGMRDLATVDTNNVTQDARDEVHLRQTQLWLQYQAGTHRAAQRLLPRVQDSGHNLPSADALELLK